MANDDRKSSGGKTAPRALARPVLLAALSAAAIAGVLWQTGNAPFSKTQPYQDDLAQTPTGAGTKPEGVIGAQDGDAPQPIDNAARIEGSTDASDLETVERPPENTVADDARRKGLEPDDAVDPPRGEIDPETGLVRAPEAEDAAEGDG
jgi:hypothetical protein